MRLFTSVGFSVLAAVVCCFQASPALAQQVISARSGVVQYVEGHVTAGGEILNPKVGEFPPLKKGEVLRTEQGRAEVLLTPGVFLRVGENSSIRMVSTSLSDTQVEFLEGSALVECDDLLKDNAITMLHNGTKVSLMKNGLYRFDGQPMRVGVYNGQAEVQSSDGKTLLLKNGHQANLEGVLVASNFDSKLEEDALYRWSSRRSDYIAMANVSAAKSIQDSGNYGGSNVWAFNPYFGMYTFVPYGGIAYSPFGYGFFSPFAAWNLYNYYPAYYGYGGYGGYGGYPTTTSGGSKGGATPYTPKQLGYSSAARGAGVGAISRGSAFNGSNVGRSSVGGFTGGRGVSLGSFSAGPAVSAGGHAGGAAAAGGGGHGH